jgi:signal transduction histidine kinase
MIGIGKSIYWKLLSFFFISITLASLVILLMFSLFGAQTEIHPRLKQFLLDETVRITEQVTLRLITTDEPLSSIINQVYLEEDVSIRVFDLDGNQKAASTKEKIQKITLISTSLIEETIENKMSFRNIFRRWMWIYVVSMPLITKTDPPLVIQAYFPRTEKPQLLMPRGLTIALLLVAAFTAVITRFLTKPIRELIKGAQEVAKGHFGVQVKVRSNDEISQLKKNFNKMSQRLADYHQSRKELFADISHEIRSPLARIQSDAEILIDRDMDKKDREQHLKAICEDVNGINQVIEDLSMLTKIEFNQLQLSPKPASIQHLLTQEISKFRLQMEEKNITLKEILPPSIPLVTMDAKRIGQVISNLLTNSLRYTPHNGNIEIGLEQSGSLVKVWVKDTGPGIPQEALTRIFNRFYRVDKSRSRISGGTGLGLAIAKHFVEAHGGTIQAESEVGKGTCISFTIPLGTTT